MSSNEMDWINRAFPNISNDTEAKMALSIIYPVLKNAERDLNRWSEIVGRLDYFIMLSTAREADKKDFSIGHGDKSYLTYQQ